MRTLFFSLLEDSCKFAASGSWQQAVFPSAHASPLASLGCTAPRTKLRVPGERTLTLLLRKTLSVARVPQVWWTLVFFCGFPCFHTCALLFHWAHSVLFCSETEGKRQEMYWVLQETVWQQNCWFLVLIPLGFSLISIELRNLGFRAWMIVGRHSWKKVLIADLRIFFFPTEKSNYGYKCNVVPKQWINDTSVQGN